MKAENITQTGFDSRVTLNYTERGYTIPRPLCVSRSGEGCGWPPTRTPDPTPGRVEVIGVGSWLGSAGRIRSGTNVSLFVLYRSGLEPQSLVHYNSRISRYSLF